MNRARFAKLVEEALERIPERIKGRLDNVAVVVEDRPTPREERYLGRDMDLLLGLYEGQPLTERDTHYGMTMPDKITIFKENVEAVCHTDEEIREQIRLTILHEVAHHFGIDDDRLDELDY